MKTIKQHTKRLLALFLAFLMIFTMIPATSYASETSEGTVPAETEPSPYGYDETDADSVTVNVTLSNDGFPIKGQDGTTLSNLEITVPYFDLANYGLEDYYRYETENEVYAGTEVIKRPTLLHLYIYLIERYYIEIASEECGMGTSGLFEYAEEETVCYLDDTEAYSSNGTNAFALSGSATSMYMTNFWGHSENLMYYRNHRYPLMSTGYGSTADYILLSDGDRIDLGMFSNWNFYTSGAFLSFDQEKYIVNTENTFTIATRSTGTSAVDDSGVTPIEPYTGELDLQMFNAEWEPLNFEYTYNQDGTYTVEAPAVGGTYYVMACDPNAKTSNSDKAPATAVVNVKGEEVYDVTVNVVPSTANVTFYADQNAEEVIDENIITDNGIVGNYHQYVLKLKEGDYSYRAVDGETSLGGMSFSVPIDDEILSDGSASGEGQTITLARTNWYTTNTAVANIGDYTLRLLPGSYPQAVNGDQYIDENNRVVTPVMVLARGNALTYQAAVTVNGELAESYAVSPLSNLTFSASASAAIDKTFTLTTIVQHTITAPKEAKVQMFNQLKNFNVEEIPVKVSTENEDGTVTHTFATPGGNNLTYRVSMEGKITRAGYMGRTAENLVITFEENEDPLTTENKMDNANMQGRIESSTMLNVNAQNNLKLGVGDTFRMRAYRGAWQIINSDTANIMIEPDFNYTILSGAEHIEMTPATNRCTGNAGTGDASNWMDIKGISEGTAVLEVTYDAIQIGGEGTTYDGLYGATDPVRKSLVIINVGESSNTLSITADGASHTWDTEFDTVYFTEETGRFTFSAVLGEEAPETVELSTDNGSTWKVLEAADGKYTAAGLVGGNNILKVTKGDLKEYQVVRAAKVTYTVTNTTRENDIIEGDTLNIVFKGFYTPLSKFSGIYNPGFASPNHNMAYTLPEGVTATASGGQYNFITNNSYKVTFETSGEYTLTNGHIYHSNMGSTPGEHRKLTDDGIGTDFNASNGNYERSVFPDLTFRVIEMPIIPVTLNVDVEEATIILTDVSGNEVTSDETGVYNLEYATYNYVISKDGYVTERGSFTLSSKDGNSKTLSVHMRKVEGAIWDGITVTEPTIVNDVYQIGTGAELAWFAKNAGGTSYNAILTADISLGGFNWTPIANSSGWKGTFDGNGHYVTDLYINSTAKNVALFGYVSGGAVIKNLGVKGEVTTTDRYAAGIVTAKVATIDFTVENCKSEVNVTADRFAGGIICNQGSKATVKNCYNTGKITITRSGGSNAGGVSCASGDTQKVIIENCYNIGKLSGAGKHGSVVYVKGASYAVNVKNSYGLVATCNTATIAGKDVTTAELKALAPTLGEAYISNPTSYNNGYPILTWEEARVLPIAKAELSDGLDTYKNTDDYREAEKTELANIISEAIAAIDAAETIDAIQPIVDAAKVEMDALKTDAEYAADEMAAALAAAKETGKKEVSEYKNADDYREAEKTELVSIISEAVAAIDAAETIDEIQPIVDAAKVEMDALKTDAEYTAEELAAALAAAKEALQETVDAAEAMDTTGYTEESVAALEEAIESAKAVLENADATAKEVEDAAKEIQEAIDALAIPVVENEVVRLFGQGRYDTAYAVADKLKEVLGVEKFEAVVVATGKNFADALAGSYFAVEKNAPILLTNGKDANVTQLHEYIKANVVEGGKVYILGGVGAVPETVDAIDGYDVVRLFGDSRYDTNIEILKEAGVAGDSIIVATGKTFADSLSASAAKLPILLVKPNSTLNDAQKEILTGMKNIYIVGGDGAVSESYAEELAAYGTVTRVFGQSRYDTSVEVAKTFCSNVTKAVVASGKNFPDGLCGGPLAAALDAPLILTLEGKTAAAAGYVAENGIASGYVLGGDGALSDEAVIDIFGLESAEGIILK